MRSKPKLLQYKLTYLGKRKIVYSGRTETIAYSDTFIIIIPSLRYSTKYISTNSKTELLQYKLTYLVNKKKLYSGRTGTIAYSDTTLIIIIPSLRYSTKYILTNSKTKLLQYKITYLVNKKKLYSGRTETIAYSDTFIIIIPSLRYSTKYISTNAEVLEMISI